MKKNLVITSLESTWPSDGRPILFLGKWCLRFDRKFIWNNLNFEVARYHWDDRIKLHKDYIYLQELYDFLFPLVSRQLNLIHGVNYSLRYWRIIIGHWLNGFIHILFDRWEMLRIVFLEHEIVGIRTIKNSDSYYVPNDMMDFNRLHASDYWNENIYTKILDWLRIPTEKVYEDANIDFIYNYNYDLYTISSKFKKLIKNVINNIGKYLIRDQDYFFIATHLGYYNEAMLQVNLGQMPMIWHSSRLAPINYDESFRKWNLAFKNDNDKFVEFVCSMIPRHMPKAYLEGYNTSIANIEKLSWPKNPKAIFTSDSWANDDLFKIWTAQKVEKGSKFVIGQHGGGFGTMSWVASEEHKLLISDYFISWGWTDKFSRNIIPYGVLKNLNKKLTPDLHNGVALLVGLSIPRYSHRLSSSPVSAGQWEYYFADQCQFVDSLPVNLRNQLVVRLDPTDYDLCQQVRWKERFPDLKVDNGTVSFNHLIKSARICISTYNGTTLLETLSLDFPTLIFWNPKQWELRGSSAPFFEKLKSVGIFHETPKSAACMLVTIWDDIESWWENPAVQNARREFCDKYARLSNKPLREMTKIFNNYL
jgi:putative transferase (TIGR04331 family)